MWRFAGRFIGVLLITAVLGGCGDAPLAPEQRPQFSPGDNGQGAIIEVGEHRAAFGLAVRDLERNLLLYFRWDDGFCGGVTPTEFVWSTYRDVIRLEESWLTLDKTDGFWFYVYDWHGESVTCAFLRSAARLASGRGTRLLHDNDFYPVAPYGPGPGANAYLVDLHGTLTTTAGGQVELMAQQHITALPDGTIVRWDNSVRLSPDPRS